MLIVDISRLLSNPGSLRSFMQVSRRVTFRKLTE
jgi:hypothetical protein